MIIVETQWNMVKNSMQSAKRTVLRAAADWESLEFTDDFGKTAIWFFDKKNQKISLKPIDR